MGDRTVREAVQPLPNTQPINKQLAVAGVAENIVMSGMEEWRTISITTDKDVYLGFDIGAAVTPDATNSLYLKANESYDEIGIRVAERLRFVNVVGGEQPTIRGIAWGI